MADPDVMISNNGSSTNTAEETTDLSSRIIKAASKNPSPAEENDRNVSIRRIPKREERRLNRFAGRGHISTSGKYVAKKNLEPSLCINKNHKCSNLVPEDIRHRIFNSYYKLPSVESQRNFIAKHVKANGVKRRTTSNVSSRRGKSLEYSFTVNELPVIVCKRFFMSTLNITEGMIRGSLNNLDENGFSRTDQRGRHAPSNKTPSSSIDFVSKHIGSFPVVESHHCHSQPKKLYLSSELNISKMFKLYEKLCLEEKKNPVSYKIYYETFKGMGLSFHVPKNDLCKNCTLFNNSTVLRRKK